MFKIISIKIDLQTEFQAMEHFLEMFNLFITE